MWNIDYGKRGTRRGHLSLKTLCVRKHYLLLYVDMSTQIDVNIHSMVAKTGRAGVPNAYRSLRLASARSFFAVDLGLCVGTKVDQRVQSTSGPAGRITLRGLQVE
jgi:hypothetical protein